MKQILNAMLNCIETCVPGINVKSLATFDVDYIFTQVRAKSVGESATILSACVAGSGYDRQGHRVSVVLGL